MAVFSRTPLTVAVLTGLLVGLASAVRVSRANPDRMLRGSRQGSPDSSSRGSAASSSWHKSLVASCFSRWPDCSCGALSEAERADLGFRPEGVLNIHMDVGQLGYSETQGRAFFDEVERRVRSIPGVQNVSFAFTIPMGYIRVSTAIEAEGQPVDRDSRVSAGQNMVSAEYFQTMGIQIVRGRSFERRRQRTVAPRCGRQPAPRGHAVARSGPNRPALQVARAGCVLDRSGRCREHRQVSIPLRGSATLLLRPHCPSVHGPSGAPGPRVDTGRLRSRRLSNERLEVSSPICRCMTSRA